MTTDEADEDLLARVEALFRAGIPPRTQVRITDAAGGRARFAVSALAIRCEGCGLVVPQSRTRVAHEARAMWLRDHLRCGR
jgi:hypothetical protein